MWKIFPQIVFTDVRTCRRVLSSYTANVMGNAAWIGACLYFLLFLNFNRCMFSETRDDSVVLFLNVVAALVYRLEIHVIGYSLNNCSNEDQDADAAAASMEALLNASNTLFHTVALAVWGHHLISAGEKRRAAAFESELRDSIQVEQVNGATEKKTQ